jgi:hypothetical protein
MSDPHLIHRLTVECRCRLRQDFKLTMGGPMLAQVRPIGTVRALTLVLIFPALLFSSQLASARFAQQGSKLVGTGAVVPSDQGSSVALSADGNTAIVGGPISQGRKPMKRAPRSLTLAKRADR